MKQTMRTIITTAIITASATTGALIAAGPYDDGPWPICQHEDGNTDGNECVWYNDGRAYYVTSEAYR